MSAVTIRSVQKYYGAVAAIRGVDIAIEDGEFVVLVGPSGCGKSTLLRAVAGLEDVSGGAIEIGGKDVTRHAPKDRDIAMVFQSYALYPHMTVEDNMGFGLKMRGMGRREIRERVDEAAKVLNLTDYLGRRPRELSGGQRQRVAMGRAIVRKPQVFLFDEPLSNLDAKLRVDMRAEIKALHQRLKTTSIYVTHDQVEAMTMADRIVVMRDGLVEQVGDPLHLYDKPTNVFVASFIGSPSMNLLEGKLRQCPLSSHIELNGGISVDLGCRYKAADDHSVLLGIRPEHLDLTESCGLLAGEVHVVEPTGAQTQVIVGTPVGVVSALFTERHQILPGQRISLMPRIHCLHVFDAETHKRALCAIEH
jgi:multiple sugar transport system ATP-binding protein